MHPIDSEITQEVFNKNQASGQPFPHTGRDYGATKNQTVRTIADGQVIIAGNGPVPGWLANRFMLVPGSTAGGNYVFVQHDGWVEYFGHLESIAVKTGQWLKRGQSVGGAGETGNAQGIHLHYEVIVEPCPDVFPWGRYHPQLQIDYEEALAKGQEMAISAADIKSIVDQVAAITQAQHDVTRKYIPDRTQEQHNVTRQLITDRTQAQHDVSRQFIPDRIKEK